MASTKPHLNLVFIGHVDHGKSTTVGRMLYDTKNIDEQVLKKLKELGIEILFEGTAAKMVIVSVPVGKLDDLAQLDAIKWIEPSTE